MSEYGKDIRIVTVRQGVRGLITHHRERSVKVNDKTELVKELLVAIEPLVSGATPFLEITIKESHDAKWTLVKKWKMQ